MVLFLGENILKEFPVTFNNIIVGRIQLEEEMIKKLEKGMECKFASLENEPFVLTASFKSDVDKMTMSLKEIQILEKIS